LLEYDPAPLGSIQRIAASYSIPVTTVYSWNSKLKHTAKSLGSGKDNYRSSVAKFHAVVATAQMSESELGEYLRSNGIMREDLDCWRKICEQANEAQAERARLQMSELAKEKAKVKALSTELQRKEKALAEAAALLALRKKANTIWGGTTRRQISSLDRKMAVELIYEAHQAGARYSVCVAELRISIRTFELWGKEGEDTEDKRQNPRTTIPNNVLSDEEERRY